MSALCCLFSALLVLPMSAAALDLRLPTDNQALLRKDGPGYFQFVDRTFEGQVSYPWEGGQFGFWRDPRRTGGGIAYARFHEGMDVKPMRRDERGDPLDEVRAILPGEVVHVAAPGKSNYGSYVVVRHDWGEGPFFSLYAHLRAYRVSLGQKVAAGETIALMGYTGSGIDQRRAHLHVELNLMLSRDFEAWYQQGFRTPNHHGIYNGMNLLGLDLQALYLAHAQQPELSVAAWLRQSEAQFEISVPGSAQMELLKHYPWLRTGTMTGRPLSWKIRCNAWGLPLAVTADTAPMSDVQLTWLEKSTIPMYYRTRGLVSNQGKLTLEGMRFVQLMAGT